MNKKLLSLLLLVVAAFTTAFAQETLTVYDGEATNDFVPVYGFYADAYNKCEYIMPADDLSEMQGATLTKMTWYMATPAEAVWGGNYQVYLMEVTKAAPEGAFTDLTNATLVFEGPLDGTGETIEIEFANDFTYEGGNLLVAVYQTATGTYKRGYFAGTEVAGAAMSNYNYSNLDAITAGTVRNFLPKTTFEYIPSSGVVYYKPKNLLVSEIGTNSAVLTWEAGADETSWGVEYKKAADEEWTSAGTVSEKTYTLDALAAGVKYDVRVKAIYADGESGWTQTSFATLACEATDMGEVEYLLTDTYGDGWNGNKLQIYLAGTDVLVAELSIPNASGSAHQDTELEGVVNLCYGVDYDLVWVAGSYAYETGFTLTAPSGEVIAEFHGTGSSSGGTPTPGVLTTFQINQVTCPRPTNVLVDNITYNSATITWTPGNEEQDLFEVVCTTEATPDNATPVQVNEPTYTPTLEENTTYNVFVRSICSEEDMSIWTKAVSFTTPVRFVAPENLVVTNITATSAVANWTGEAPAYNFRYREITGLNESFEAEEAPAGWTMNDWQYFHIVDWNLGGTGLVAADGESCYGSKSMDDSGSEFTPLGVDNWLISSKANLGGTLEFYVGDLGENYVENFSVYVSTTGTAAADFTPIAENVATPGVLISSASAWQKKEYDLSAYEGQQGYIAIRHHDAAGYYLFVDGLKISGEGLEAEWIYVNNTTAPVTMEPLTPSTAYECQVQGAYEDGNSQWTDIVKFTTVAVDALPTNLQVDDITANSAIATWEGSQETYNIRYRTAGQSDTYFEGFEYGLASGEFPTESGWTALDADGDGYTWYIFTPDDNTNQYVFDASCITSASYMGAALTPDDWLISPQLKLGGTLSFQVRGQDPSYADEHYTVYVSTGDPTDVTSFVELIPEAVSTGAYQEITADLSEYEGEMGYIAFRHHNCTDMFRLNIDNVTITYGAGVEPGEWVVVEGVTSPYTIEGLDPNTQYEVQVQGVVDDENTTEWTNSVFFTTLPGEDLMEEFYVVGTFNGWDQTEEGGRVELVANEEGTEYTGEVTFAEGAEVNEFKVITPSVDGGWIWFGGVDENQAGFFLIYDDLFGVDLDLVDGSNFRIEEAGTYVVTVKEAPANGPRGLAAPIVMTVTKKNPDAIDNINVDSKSNEWYNLNGQKLNGKPVTPGIYINGNKKVIVK